MLPLYTLAEFLEFINSLPDDHKIDYAHPRKDSDVSCVVCQFFMSKNIHNFVNVNLRGNEAWNKTSNEVAILEIPGRIGDIHVNASTISELKKNIAANPKWNLTNL